MTLLAKGCDQETAKKNPHEIHIPLKLILPTGTPPTGTLFLLGDGDSVVDDLNFQPKGVTKKWLIRQTCLKW